MATTVATTSRSGIVPASTKNLSLEGLRGLAALGVVTSHFLFSFFPFLSKRFVESIEIPQRYAIERYLDYGILGIFYNGSFQVSIFFVLSGYVITGKFIRTGEANVLWTASLKRLPRLMIPVFFSCLFAYLLLSYGAMCTSNAVAIGGAGWPMAQYQDKISFATMLYQSTFGVILTNTYPLNAPLWTIRIELIASFMLFASYAFSGAKSPIKALAFFLLAMMAFVPDAWQYYSLFIIGSMIHYVLNIRRLAVFLLILVSFYLGGYNNSFIYDPIRTVFGMANAANSFDSAKSFCYLVGSVFLVTGIIHSKRAQSVLSFPAFVWLGRISFAMYLLHWPIICSLGFFMFYQFKIGLGWNHDLSGCATALVVIIAVFGGSEIFTRIVDIPATSFSDYLARKTSKYFKRKFSPTPDEAIS
jgi:peptidoglycan/LPS O-acetylase OafA/YrhL